MIRCLISCFGMLVVVQSVVAQGPSLRTQVVHATYRLEHPKTSGTGFLVARPHPVDIETTQLLLVTAAHALERMAGNQTTLVLRKKAANGVWVATPTRIEIRRDGKPMWQRHPKQDVAAMLLATLDAEQVDAVPLQAIANAEDWKSITPEPGALVRCVGFPHAAQFKPSAAGFPITRLGCVASYPLVPVDQHPTFLVDYNSFEGDSGGPVYAEDLDGAHKIIGLVHAQHFLDERYKLVYREGLIRKRLGLAIIVNSLAILETIAAVP